MALIRWIHLLEAVSLIGLGICAAILPNYFTFKLEQLLGVLFIAAGSVQLVRVFIDRMQARSLLYFLIALLYFVFGIIFWIHPVVGMLSLGLILMVFLLADGIAKLLLGYQAYPNLMWAGFIGCGVLSLVMGLIIWIEWPLTSAWPRGILAGANLVLYGSAMLAFSLREQG